MWPTDGRDVNAVISLAHAPPPTEYEAALSWVRNARELTQLKRRRAESRKDLALSGVLSPTRNACAGDPLVLRAYRVVQQAEPTTYNRAFGIRSLPLPKEKNLQAEINKTTQGLGCSATRWKETNQHQSNCCKWLRVSPPSLSLPATERTKSFKNRA